MAGLGTQMLSAWGMKEAQLSKTDLGANLWFACYLQLPGFEETRGEARGNGPPSWRVARTGQPVLP